MCGIVGYVGSKNAKEVILDGLKRLEYRGYDSAGIATLINGKIEVRKHVGGISNLEYLIGDEEMKSSIGIGHTRWATHGAPSDVNSHPHLSFDSSIAVVHNGIIENYLELKKRLSKENRIKFKSETDTEVIAHLIALNLKKTTSLEEAVYMTTKEMKGAYTIVVLSKNNPDKLVAFRNDAPLIVGEGKEGNFVASDIPAVLKYADTMYPIENSEMVILTKDKIKVYDKHRKIVKHKPLEISWDNDAAEKEGYEHFLLKEIHEQPYAIRETILHRLDKKGNLFFEGLELKKEDIDKIDRVYIVACGSSSYAGLIGKYLIEKFVKLPCEADVASEFRYRNPVITKNTLFIAISGSGETSDTLQALREAKAKGAKVLSVVNVVGSSVSRESDICIYTWAGPEIAVPSTKTYTTQVTMLYLLSLYLGLTRKCITKKFVNEFIDELLTVPNKIDEFLKKSKEIERLAKRLYNEKQIFYIGRGLDSYLAYEGSLKLKQVSYINSFAIQAGELKHGTIALMEKDLVVIALSTQDHLLGKMASNIQEVKARGAYVVSVTKEGNDKIKKESDYTIYIPRARDELMPLLTVIPLQLFAYYVAKEKGAPIDKPRNLAKSVTVE